MGACWMLQHTVCATAAQQPKQFLLSLVEAALVVFAAVLVRFLFGFSVSHIYYFGRRVPFIFFE